MCALENTLSIKLRDDALRGIAPHEVFRESLGGGEWRNVSGDISKVSSAFSKESLEVIGQWVRVAQRRFPRYRPPDFSAFILVECSRNPLGVAASLHDNKYVENIFGEDVSIYSVPDGDACSEVDQGYLGEAPIGVGARHAWGISAGQDVRLIDIEEGWSLGHQDFEGLPIKEIPGGIMKGGGHGTKVLGIIAAKRDGVGVTGIAHGLKLIGLSPVKRKFSDCHSVADAIVSGGSVISAGDVILVEVDRSECMQFPIERRPEVFAVIQLLTLLDICVVEPAANGGIPLEDNGGSGAIIVGAVSSIKEKSDTYEVMGQSNYGPRVDCFAWGSNVCTTSKFGGWSFFSNTSSAAAIVAGVVAVIQGILRVRGKTKSPGEIRALLREHGAKVWRQGELQRGRVPDLREIEKIL